MTPPPATLAPESKPAVDDRVADSIAAPAVIDVSTPEPSAPEPRG